MLGLGKKSKKSLIDWRTSDKGHEVSRSSEVIVRLMEHVKAERIMFFLHHKGYNSSGTILLECDDGRLLLDMPQNWPGTERSIRVDFNGPEGLRYYFYSDVRSSGRDSMEQPLPQEVFRMQLRSFYRVELPSGSTVSFEHKKQAYEKLTVKDMSAGGLKFTSKDRLEFERFDLITKIVITVLPPPPPPKRPMSLVERQKMGVTKKTLEEQPPTPPRCLDVRSAKIVHISFDNQQKTYGYGMQFRLDSKVQEKLQQFVRQRELEIARQGVI